MLLLARDVWDAGDVGPVPGHSGNTWLTKTSRRWPLSLERAEAWSGEMTRRRAKLRSTPSESPPASSEAVASPSDAAVASRPNGRSQCEQRDTS